MNKKEGSRIAKGKGSRHFIQIKGPPVAFKCDPSVAPLDPFDFTRQVYFHPSSLDGIPPRERSYRSETDRMFLLFSASPSCHSALIIHINDER